MDETYEAQGVSGGDNRCAGVFGVVLSKGQDIFDALDEINVMNIWSSDSERNQRAHCTL
jgi:hypothetical protein